MEWGGGLAGAVVEVGGGRLVGGQVNQAQAMPFAQ